MTKITVDKALIERAIEAHAWALDHLPNGAAQTKVLASSKALRAAMAEPVVEPEKTNAKESNADLDFCSNAAINEQRRNMVGEVEVGQLLGNGQHQSAGNSEPQGTVAVITGFDEYGPFLGWNTHWVNFPVGTKLYTSPPPLADPAVEPAAVRYDFDGYGWKYIDNGSGSDWLERGMNWKDHELVYTSLLPPAEVPLLSDEEIMEMVTANAGYGGTNFDRVARAIEQAVRQKTGYL